MFEQFCRSRYSRRTIPLNCVNYVLEYPKIKELGATEQMVRDVLKQMGFSEGKSAGEGETVMTQSHPIRWLAYETSTCSCYASKSRYSTYG